MKNLFILTTVASLLVAPIAFADDSHHPEKAQESKAAATKAAKAAPVKATQSDQSMMAMHGQMQKMRDHMAKIQATTDPAERQKLVQEHMQMMSEGMKMMNGMGGGMMMGMMGDADAGKDHEKSGSERCSMMGDHGMMGKRMDMMQMMMEQMMEHQKAVEAPSK